MSRLSNMGFILVILLLSACQETTVQQDMDEYCNCIQTGELTTCEELKQEISDKYAFDPEASSYIQERLLTCE